MALLESNFSTGNTGNMAILAVLVILVILVLAQMPCRNFFHWSNAHLSEGRTALG